MKKKRNLMIENKEISLEMENNLETENNNKKNNLDMVYKKTSS